MSVYPAKTLLDMWDAENITHEQATGQGLQYIVEFEATQLKLLGRISGLEHTNKNLAQNQETLIIKLNHLQNVMNKLLNLPGVTGPQQEAAQAELAQLQQGLTPLRTVLVVKPKKVNTKKRKVNSG